MLSKRNKEAILIIALCLIFAVTILVALIISLPKDTTQAFVSSLADENTVTETVVSVFESSSTVSSKVKSEPSVPPDTVSKPTEKPIIAQMTPTKLINVPFISQVEKYKTGCESVSTVMVMNYYGINITPEIFIDNYLEKGDFESFNPNYSFGGDPYTNRGFGCYAPVIAKASRKYFKENKLNFTAKTVVGMSLESLCEQYVDNDIPVIIWATMYMKEPYNGSKIPYGDGFIQWIAPEHCLVLTGYDDENYIFNDPLLTQKTYYKKSDVLTAYKGLGQQTVIITPTEPDFSSTAPTVSIASKIEDIFSSNTASK